MIRKATIILSIIGALVVIWAGWHFDFPAVADAPPWPIAKVLEGTSVHCYVYPLGGFIDKDFLWRIDGTEASIASVIRALDMKPSATIPKAFWSRPPYYWPQAQRNGMIAYRSSGFADDNRGDDGEHFFLIHDTDTNRAYVWFRDNF